MKKLMEECKNLTYTPTTVTILSALNEKSSAQLSALSKELCCASSECATEQAESGKKFICKICGYVYEGAELPADFVCPLCKRGAEEFEELK
jgi:rubrerythrin